MGYFPAEDPLYSCIVVVNAPSNSVYYGNLVAGPVFKEISDKVYSTRFFRENRIARNTEIARQAPDIGNGYRDDMDDVLHELRIKYNKTTNDDWVVSRESGDTINIVPVESQPGLMPDVRGMTLRDAIYVLENSGLRVSYNGRGKVRRQSPEHGARIRSGDRVSLELRM